MVKVKLTIEMEGICDNCDKKIKWGNNEGYWLVVDYGTDQFRFCSQKCIMEYIKNDYLEHFSDSED